MVDHRPEQKSPKGYEVASPRLSSTAAFEDAYLRNAGLMRAVAVERFRIPFDEAEELVHDIFASYLTNPSVVRGELRPYLLGAMWNAARTYLRKKGREEQLGAFPSDSELTDIADRVLTQLTVAQVFAQLDPSCRDALISFYTDDERGKQLAERLRLSRNAVHKRLSICRQKARAILRSLRRPPE